MDENFVPGNKGGGQMFNVNGFDKKIDFPLLAFFLIFAFFMRSDITVRLFPDSINYLTYTKNILSGIHHNGDITLARHKWSPLYPHLTALFTSGGSSPVDLAQAARWVSVMAGTLLVLPTYLLGLKIFGRIPAVVSSVLLSITPEFLYYSGAVLTESLATLFVTLSLYMIWITTEREQSGAASWYLPALTGIALGLAFLSRHAVIGFLPIVVIWFAGSRFLASRGTDRLTAIKNTMMGITVIVTAFFLTLSPQTLYLHSQTNQFALVVDPTSGLARSLQASGGDVRYTSSYEAWHSLTPDLKSYGWEVEKPQGLFDFILKEPAAFLSGYISTVLGGYLPDTYPLPYPPIILLLTLAGILSMIWARRFKPLLFCLWGFGGYYLFLALFQNIRDRYLFPGYPLILLVAGAGAAGLLTLLSRIVRTQKHDRKVRLAGTGFILVLILATVLPTSTVLIKKMNTMSNMDSLMALGRDISKRIDPGAVMFDRNPHTPFFAGAVPAAAPYARPEEVVQFARNKGVRYLAVSSSYVPRLRPQYLPLLDPGKKHEGLVPVAIYGNSARNRLVIYQITGVQ